MQSTVGLVLSLDLSRRHIKSVCLTAAMKLGDSRSDVQTLSKVLVVTLELVLAILRKFRVINSSYR